MAPAHPARQAPAVEDHPPGDQGDGDARPDPHPVPVDATQQVLINEAAAETHDRGDHDHVFQVYYWSSLLFWSNHIPLIRTIDLSFS